MLVTAQDINRVFTKEVEKFIAKGYTYNCNTMAGHQGEIAKIDLLSPDKKQIARVVMDRGRQGCDMTVTVTTRLYSAKDEGIDVDGLSQHNTLWTEHGTEYNKLTYYPIDPYSKNRVFTDKQGIDKINDIRVKRALRKQKDRPWTICTVTILDSQKAKEAVLPFVRRQNRCKTYQVKDIGHIQKSYNPHSKKTTYSVKAKDHWFELQ